MNDELKILYEDEELLVCRKPAGVPVQSAKTVQKDMVSIVNNYLAETQADIGSLSEKENRGQANAGRKTCQSVYVVHRLDQPVEGVLVFAKTKRAAAELSRQVSDGSMKKLYRAVCCVRVGKACAEDRREAGRSGGRVTEEGQEKKRGGTNCGRNRFRPDKEYCLVDYLVKDGRTNSSSVAEPGSRDAKRAELSFRILGKKESELSHADVDRAVEAPEKNENRMDTACAGNDDGQEDCADRKGNGYFLIEIALKTGRHHQIRVQMAHAGLPLYGDRKYNENWQDFLTESDRTLLSGRNAGDIPLALCAAALSFRHPASGKRMEFRTTPQAEIFSLFGFH